MTTSVHEGFAIDTVKKVITLGMLTIPVPRMYKSARDFTAFAFAHPEPTFTLAEIQSAGFFKNGKDLKAFQTALNGPFRAGLIKLGGSRRNSPLFKMVKKGDEPALALNKDLIAMLDAGIKPGDIKAVTMDIAGFEVTMRIEPTSVGGDAFAKAVEIASMLSDGTSKPKIRPAFDHTGQKTGGSVISFGDGKQ